MMDIEFHNQDLTKYSTDDAGLKLRDEIEQFVSKRDITRLRNVDELLVLIVSRQVTNKAVSFIDLDEYVSYAIEQLENNVSDAEIYSSPLRMNMYL